MLRKLLRKFQSNFQHYVKKIVTQVKEMANSWIVKHLQVNPINGNPIKVRMIGED